MIKFTGLCTQGFGGMDRDRGLMHVIDDCLWLARGGASSTRFSAVRRAVLRLRVITEFKAQLFPKACSQVQLGNKSNLATGQHYLYLKVSDDAWPEGEGEPWAMPGNEYENTLRLLGEVLVTFPLTRKKDRCTVVIVAAMRVSGHKNQEHRRGTVMRECSGLVTGGQVDAGGGRGFPEMRAEGLTIGVTGSLIGDCPYLSIYLRCFEKWRTSHVVLEA
jgi:hypothetical protein